MYSKNSRNTHAGASPNTGAGTPHFTETQQFPIAPPAPSAPLMSQSVPVAPPVLPATAPVYHTHEAEIDLSGDNGQSTFDSLKKQGV